ncbi:MAG TPA: hypothetical protein VGL62_07625 [Vicinamibacterales bacterium]|jgi:hypothetical protein
MTKILCGAVLAAALCAVPGTQLIAASAGPAPAATCDTLFANLVGPPSPALTGRPVARLRAWAERRTTDAAASVRGLAIALSAGDVLLTTKQLSDVADNVRLLARDAHLVDIAQARHCAWAQDASRTLSAH